MPHINFFFIAIVLNEYYQYYILFINYYLTLCVSQCIFRIQFACIGLLETWFTWNFTQKKQL